MKTLLAVDDSSFNIMTGYESIYIGICHFGMLLLNGLKHLRTGERKISCDAGVDSRERIGLNPPGSFCFLCIKLFSALHDLIGPESARTDCETEYDCFFHLPEFSVFS